MQLTGSFQELGTWRSIIKIKQGLLDDLLKLKTTVWLDKRNTVTSLFDTCSASYLKGMTDPEGIAETLTCRWSVCPSVQTAERGQRQLLRFCSGKDSHIQYYQKRRKCERSEQPTGEYWCVSVHICSTHISVYSTTYTEEHHEPQLS